MRGWLWLCKCVLQKSASVFSRSGVTACTVQVLFCIAYMLLFLPAFVCWPQTWDALWASLQNKTLLQGTALSFCSPTFLDMQKVRHVGAFSNVNVLFGKVSLETGSPWEVLTESMCNSVAESLAKLDSSRRFESKVVWSVCKLGTLFRCLTC